MNVTVGFGHSISFHDVHKEVEHVPAGVRIATMSCATVCANRTLQDFWTRRMLFLHRAKTSLLSTILLARKRESGPFIWYSLLVPRLPFWSSRLTSFTADSYDCLKGLTRW